MSISYANHLAILNPDTVNEPITIIGMGSIGSLVFFGLTACGIRDIHIYDADRLEEHNMPTQPIYRISDRGKLKVDAAEDYALRQEYTGKITKHYEFVGEDTPLSGIVISGVDSMKARYDIWGAVKKNFAEIPLYIDGRIGGESAEIIPVNPLMREERKQYETDCLFSDEESDQLPCGGRAIIGPVMACGGIISHMIANHFRDEDLYHQYLNLRDASYTVFVK